MFHHFIILIRFFLNKFISIPFPTLVSGENSLKEIYQIINTLPTQSAFIVTDKNLLKLGITDSLFQLLEKQNIPYDVFDELTPDPTVEQVSAGVQLFKQKKYGCIIAFGGGSVIDCTKAIAAAAIKDKPILSLSGLFKVRKTLPVFIAIPTTAGTGSEATLVAVITDSQKSKKFTVIDPCLVPNYAVLDPLLMTGLPKNITAETGVDALTHAIESYIGRHATIETKEYGLKAIEKILINLPVAYENGDNLQARQEMSIASYEAGVAFTRASIGYVHAIAHQLGGLYHIPHGLANAVLLKHVLWFSFEQAKAQYASLSYALDLAETSESEELAAKAFLDTIEGLLEQLNIPNSFEHLKKEDIPLIAQRATREAFCEYPVPKLMNQMECEKILYKISS